MLDTQTLPTGSPPGPGPSVESGAPETRRVLAGILWTVICVGSLLSWLPVTGFSVILIGLCTGVLFQGDLRGAAIGRAIRDWFGVAAWVVLYGMSRSIADTLGMPIREQSMITIDRMIGLGELPTHRMQRLIDWDSPAAWWEAIFSATYVSHFVIGFTILTVLFVRDRVTWGRWVRRWVLLGCLGLIGYVLLPTVPPWLASNHETVDLVYRGLPRGWDAVKGSFIHDLFSFGEDRANPIAAMPSLHAAYPALVLLFFGPRGSRLRKAVLVGYTVLMAVTIVITGQHWVIDIFAGWFVAWLAHTLMTRWETRANAPPRTAAAGESRG